MNDTKIYDCMIVGGGLAGLSLAILLGQKKYRVLLIEKKSYPYHKVCGEYISMESKDFLKRLGVALDEMNLPQIKKLCLSDVNGLFIEQALDMGGFGLSRYKLDAYLARIAKENGVTLLENATANSYLKTDNTFQINTTAGNFSGRILCASFGKHAFGNFYKANSEKENWVGVKYHIQTNFPDNLIALHNFKGGYCGISKIEEEKYCLCYLVKSSQLKKYKNSIIDLEKFELQRNPFLKKIITEAVFLFDKPVTVSNVTFSAKSPVHNHVFYLGDSAGTIAPLSGNGMSNALRSADMLAKRIEKYINNECSFKDLETNYTKEWNKAFNKRIQIGRIIQRFFCTEYLTSIFISIVKYSKPLRLMIIRQTHGESF